MVTEVTMLSLSSMRPPATLAISRPEVRFREWRSAFKCSKVSSRTSLVIMTRRIPAIRYHFSVRRRRSCRDLQSDLANLQGRYCDCLKVILRAPKDDLLDITTLQSATGVMHAK